MDIKEIIDKTTKKIKNDPKILDKFKKDPEKTVEGISGVNIPDGMLDKVVAGVKAKISVDKAGDVLDKIKKIF